MNDLIKIEEREGQQTVNARELWEKLESKQQFADWIKNRLEGFTEKSDYLVHKIMNNLIGGRPNIEYYLTIDTAKHLAMLERNEQGKAIRQYFIEVEKKAREVFQVPKTYAEALRLAADQALEIEQKTAALAIAAPKVAFFDQVADSKTALQMRDVAAALNIPGWGRNKIFELLRDKGILDGRNVPYRQFQDAGYFRVIEQSYTDKVGETHISLKTLVYQRSVDYVRKIIEKA